MTDRIEIPTEVLDVFRKIKAVADAAVEYLESLQTGPAVVHVNATDSAALIEHASVGVRPEPVSGALDTTLPALTGSLTGKVTLPPLPTVDEVEMARTCIKAIAAGGGITILVITQLEGLLQFAERLLKLAGKLP